MVVCRVLMFVSLMLNLPYIYAETMLLTDQATLAKVKRVLNKAEDTSAFALNNLIRNADKDLAFEPVSVKDSAPLMPDGNALDYYSVGPYWWPNENTENGLPWVRRDGEINPEPRKPNADNLMFYRMSLSIYRLGLAYYFTDDVIYAEKINQLIKHWFVDPDTAMNPNLNFGQSVPGVANGRPYGLIEIRHLLQIIDSVTMTKDKLEPKVVAVFDAWLEDFWQWLISSEIGLETATKTNNHGTFYDTLLVGLGLYLGKSNDVKEILERSKKRIVHQIEPNGAQPEELARTRPFHYSAFNLQGFTRLAVMAEQVNVDLWNYPNADDQRITKAFLFLVNDKNRKQIWQKKKPKKKNYQLLVSPSFRIAQRFGTDLSALYKDPSSHNQISMCGMLFGVSIKDADKKLGWRRYDCKL